MKLIILKIKNLKNVLFARKLKFIFSISAILILVISCNSGLNSRSEIIYLYSKDRSQIITILTDYPSKERIIALGKLTTKPKDNYIKLNIAGITELGDEIGVCWFKKSKGWQLVNNQSKIIEVQLDTTKYIVKTSWYEDEHGIPNTAFYEKENCYTFGTLDYSEIHPVNGGYMERIK